MAIQMYFIIYFAILLYFSVDILGTKSIIKYVLYIGEIRYGK